MNIFKGKRVRLRAKNLSDVERDIATINSIEYNTEIDRMTGMIHLPFSTDAIKGDLEKEVMQSNDWENCNLIIETLDKVAVGGIVISNADRKDGCFSYGLGIKEEHRRKGYASEAIILLLNYYFNELRFHKCNLSIYDFNESSKRLHKKLGFIEEGRQRESKYSQGKYHDIIFYGISEEEFRKAHDCGV